MSAFADASELRSLPDLDAAWRTPSNGPRLSAVRSAGALLRERLASSQRALSVRTFDQATLFYPTKYAFWGAALSPAPFVVMTHRALLVQFLQRGEVKNLLFNPTDVVASRETPFLRKSIDMLGEFLALEVLTKTFDPLETQLSQIGIAPSDIDYVAFDHFHTQDLRTLLGTQNGSHLSRFPKAKLLAPANEWAAWDDVHPVQRAWFVADGKRGVKTTNVALTAGDLELGEGVWLIRTPGHTVGNQTLFVKTDSGVWGSSENGVSADSWSPLDSRIPGLARQARLMDVDLVLNTNTPEWLADQYTSMVLERTLVDRVKRAPSFIQMLPSSEVTPSLLSPGIRPSMIHRAIESGTVVRRGASAARSAPVDSHPSLPVANSAQIGKVPAFMAPTASPFLQGEDDLFEPLRAAEKPKERWRIGAEAEKFGVDKVTGAPLPYESASGRSVQAILDALVERHGWTPEPESPGGPLIALRRGEASVTLEPGGQLELSGAPLADIHAICSEARGHLAEIRDISAELNLVWLGVGFHPFARQAELDWVPKSRYAIMRVYLPSRGRYALDMMRRTATVQANYDFDSEEDAMRKLRVALKLSPLTTAIFANSPFYEGRPWGGRSYRARVWTDVDNDRSGLVPGVWKEGSRYSDYIEWALDVPMFLIKREGKVIENTGQSFRSFLRHGCLGHRATAVDWETHINTIFPEVRLKRTLEIRGADSLPVDLACALPALWTGILYDEAALAEAEELTRDFQHDEVAALREVIPEQALMTPFRGKPLAELAGRVMAIAEGGLSRRARLSRDGKDERVHLARLGALVAKGQCPADALLEGLETSEGGDFTGEMLRRAKMT